MCEAQNLIGKISAAKELDVGPVRKDRSTSWKM